MQTVVLRASHSGHVPGPGHGRATSSGEIVEIASTGPRDGDVAGRQDRPMSDTLTLTAARTIADRVLATAAEADVAITVVVVDAHGADVLTLRMDGAAPFTPYVARQKARSAVLMRADSANLAGLQTDYPELLPLVSDGAGFRVTSLAGGLLLVRDDVVAGAVAVSGAHPDVDVACASAGRDAWTG
jgi:glc operon protein GlcG